MNSNQVALPIVSFVWRKKIPLLLIFFVANVCVWLAFRTITPIYESSALILADSSRVPDRDKEVNEGPNRADQFIYSQALLVLSESVIRSAVVDFGSENLYPPRRRGLISGFLRTVVNHWLFPLTGDISSGDSAYIEAWRATTVRPEPKTDIIRISYRNEDPEIAAGFLSSLVQRYIGRYVELTSKQRAVDFMQRQREQAEEEFMKASRALSEFSEAEQLYSADEQQKLLLARQSTLQTALADTVVVIAEKDAQSKEISRQLASLRSQDATALTSERPSVLSQVSEKAMESLVRTNAELSGSRQRQVGQQSELATIDQKLANISSKRAQFESLRREVELTGASAETFAKRLIEQQVNLSFAQQRLQKLQVAQEPTVAIKPVFPTRTTIVGAGVALGLIADLVYAIALLSFVGKSAQPRVRGTLGEKLALNDVGLWTN